MTEETRAGSRPAGPAADAEGPAADAEGPAADADGTADAEGTAGRTEPPGAHDRTPLVRTAAGTVCGTRPANHDRVLTDGSVLLLADGVGGAPGGDVAATLALTAAAAHLAESLVRGVTDAAGAVRAADRRVHLTRCDPDLRHASSTLTVAVLYDDEDGPATDLAWLGDSGAWLLRAGRLQQLTRPHTGSQALAEGGYLPYDQVARHALANRLLDACGSGTSEPETLTVPLLPGDRLLVASDGLPEALDAHLVGRLLALARSPGTAVAALLGAAEPEASDNVTVAVAFLEPYAAAAASGASGPLRRARPPHRPGPVPVPDRTGGATRPPDADAAPPTTPLPRSWSATAGTAS